MFKFDDTDFIAKTNALATELESAAEDIAHSGAHRVWEKSQDLVPVDTGLLRSTGYLATKTAGVKTQIEIGYGGAISGFEDEYVWYAGTQEKNRNYLSSSVTPDLFISGVRQAFKLFLLGSEGKRKANPPYASQSNPASAGLVVVKKNKDSGTV